MVRLGERFKAGASKALPVPSHSQQIILTHCEIPLLQLTRAEYGQEIDSSWRLAMILVSGPSGPVEVRCEIRARAGSLQRPGRWPAQPPIQGSPKEGRCAARRRHGSHLRELFAATGAVAGATPDLESPRNEGCAARRRQGSHLRDTARGLSSLHRPLRALSRSPTPKRVGRVQPRRARNGPYSFPPAPE